MEFYHIYLPFLRYMKIHNSSVYPQHLHHLYIGCILLGVQKKNTIRLTGVCEAVNFLFMIYFQFTLEVSLWIKRRICFRLYKHCMYAYNFILLASNICILIGLAVVGVIAICHTADNEYHMNTNRFLLCAANIYSMYIYKQSM